MVLVHKMLKNIYLSHYNQLNSIFPLALSKETSVHPVICISLNSMFYDIKENIFLAVQQKNCKVAEELEFAN